MRVQFRVVYVQFLYGCMQLEEIILQFLYGYLHNQNDQEFEQWSCEFCKVSKCFSIKHNWMGSFILVKNGYSYEHFWAFVNRVEGSKSAKFDLSKYCASPDSGIPDVTKFYSSDNSMNFPTNGKNINKLWILLHLFHQMFNYLMH